MTTCLVSTVDTNLAIKLIYGIISQHTPKGILTPPFVQVMSTGEAENDGDCTLIICDSRVHAEVSKHMKLETFAPKTLPETPESILGINIILPSNLLLSHVQMHLIRVIDYMAIWMNVERVNLVLTYPGASRISDFHKGLAVLEITKAGLTPEQLQIFKIVLEHQWWPTGLFMKTSWYRKESPKTSTWLQAVMGSVSKNSVPIAPREDNNTIVEEPTVSIPIIKENTSNLPIIKETISDLPVVNTSWSDRVKANIKKNAASKEQLEDNPYGLSALHPLSNV